MGRLDDHAKKRIVELRKAGLSFRKIKKVLELDNIRVTPQAIYLFLKRKNVEPSQPPPACPLPPALEKGSRKLGMDPAGWEDDQLWNLLQENESGPNKQKELAGSKPPGLAGGVGVSGEALTCNSDWDGKEGIKIISITSLSKDGEQFGRQNAVPRGISMGSQLRPSVGDACSAPQASGLASCSAPAVLSPPQQNLNGKGRVFLPPAKNPALIVKRKIVGRAIHLQKKANVQNAQNPSASSPAPGFMLRVQPTSHPSNGGPSVMPASFGCSTHTKDASTQTSTLNPIYSTSNQNSEWGGQIAASLIPSTSLHSFVEKLDTVHTEVQKLAQAMHMVLERQCRLERQQEQQQRFQQEVLMTLQQLSSTISHGAAPGNQPCAPYGNMADPSPSLPNFSHFKMELI
ncbi:uncharacterized protein LOC128336552 [Hemicordylus capensis]|uniref:uncharacterized protein LOC128336552 n=1 Tax=Hemicordylus capensis TaxID=884348 RepID=UPI002303AD65|nr:uncharacterized protein LOC128336552 [Hemicordylus capensis]